MGKKKEKESATSKSSGERPHSNIGNFILMIAVAGPALYYNYYLHHHCPQFLASAEAKPYDQWDAREQVCYTSYQHPIVAVNGVFFVNVCVVFWILSLIQNSTWLIDPYWTYIPVMIGHFYWGHPNAGWDTTRGYLTMAALWCWSIRLTHSYFRREQWQLGAREDWRFDMLKKRFGKHWWWISFFAAYVSQQFMLVGITLPLYAVFSSQKPFDFFLDGIPLLACFSGIICAYFADTQLYNFMQANEERKKQGKPKVLVLKTGIWRYSRRPNYFSEQLWWWGLALLAVRLGHPWMVIGTVINSAGLAAVTGMVEERMLADKERHAAYKQYMRTTSVWIPLPPSKPSRVPASKAN